ncbi:AbiV family abortive infection protein [Alicyclobacillus tolerans]|uniref:AbiV family abortive infection protein n=1 Tax=Alicyclobacillus tolerans TaxID=90970 RepID=UPI001F1DF91F|nr:AbiV family abortive infection protein [Alicyclobacillus tolerans]MCF8564993.1 AbiV family abortive infection protein [Alicyclobacillus tolerans]
MERNPSAEEAYNLIPLAIENAIGFIDAAELLCKSEHYAHGFILASYAVEEIGKAGQLQAIASGFGEHLTLRNHREKNKVFLMQTYMNYMIVKYQNKFEQFSRELGSEKFLDQNELQTLAANSPEIQKEVEQFISNLSETFSNDWMDLRFDLLYTNIGDTRSVHEKWAVLRQKFEIARLVESGIAFQNLRDVVELFRMNTPACYEGIAFEDFRNSIPDWIYEYRRNIEAANKEKDAKQISDLR